MHEPGIHVPKELMSKFTQPPRSGLPFFPGHSPHGRLGTAMVLEFLAHWECILTQGERTVRKYNFRLPGKHISIYQNHKSPHSSFQECVNQRPLDLIAALWSSTWASLTNSEKMDGEWLVKSWLVTRHNIVTVPNLRSANQRGMCSPLRPVRNHVGVFQIHSVPYCP